MVPSLEMDPDFAFGEGKEDDGSDICESLEFSGAIAMNRVPADFRVDFETFFSFFFF